MKIADLYNQVQQRYGGIALQDVNELRFEAQRKFAADENHFRAALCGRRAGKTRELIYEFYESLRDHPGDDNVFVELTRPSAKKKIWRPFKRLNDIHGWGLKFGESELTVSHQNGAILHIVGADKQQEIDKIRGLERLRKAAIDECGAQKPMLLQYLVEEVLEPALMDVDGYLTLSGTPGLAMTGYWYDVSGKKPPNPGWSIHKWTAYNNPHIDAARLIAKLLKRRAWTKDNPIFQREYLGRWIFDIARLVYAWSDEDNVIDTLPSWDKTWSFVLGMDFGTVASTAWSVLGYPPIGNKVYIFESFKEAGLAPTEVADRTRDLIQKWKPGMIVGDLGGLGKAYAAEMIKRHKIPILAAQKQEKRAMIEYMSDALRTGHLLSYKDNVTLHEEFKVLLWDEERKEIAEGQDDHETDAARYAWRECPAYAQAIAEPLDERDGLPPWVDRDGIGRAEEKPFWHEEEW